MEVLDFLGSLEADLVAGAATFHAFGHGHGLPVDGGHGFHGGPGKGVFAGLTLDGAVVKTDDDSMKAVYGPDVTERAALTGNVPPPAEAHEFLAAIRGARAQASAAKPAVEPSTTEASPGV